MIFSKKLRKTAACVLTLVMLFAMSTGAFAADPDKTGYVDKNGDYVTEAKPLEVTAVDGYYNLTVNYVVAGGTLPKGAQVSIIALDDYTSTTDVEDVIVKFDGSNTATNVLWIDQYDAAQTNGSVEVTVAESAVSEDAEGFWIKSGITGGNTMAAWVAIKEDTTGDEGGEGGDTPVSTEVGINSITVAGTAATLSGTTATVELTAALTDPQNQIAVDKKDANAQVAIAVAGENTYTITVTNGGATATYTLNVTVKAPAETYMVLYGDLNGDGKINGGDGTIMARRLGFMISEFIAEDGTVLQDKVGDLNGDGKINGGDGTIMARRLGFMISEFIAEDGTVLYEFDNNAK